MAFPLPTPSPSYSLCPADASILSKLLWTSSQVFQGKSFSEFIWSLPKFPFVCLSFLLSLYLRMLVAPLAGSALSVSLLPLQCLISLISITASSSLPWLFTSFSCSVTQSCPTLCNPTDCSTPGFPVLQHLLEFSQTHVHWVDDPPTSSSVIPFFPAFNFSQHLFQWVSSSHQVAEVLEFQLQHQSFQWIFRVGFLLDWLVWSPCGPRDSQESSSAPQFGSINSSMLSLLYGPTLTSIHDYWKNHSLD